MQALLPTVIHHQLLPRPAGRLAYSICLERKLLFFLKWWQINRARTSFFALLCELLLRRISCTAAVLVNMCQRP